MRGTEQLVEAEQRLADVQVDSLLGH